MKKSCMAVLGAACIALGGTRAAQAVPTTYFGEDLNGVETPLASHPNADTAKTAFFATLTSPLTEGFEGFSTGAMAPLLNLFGPGTATLTDPSNLGVVASSPAAGRYPVSGAKYWDTVADFPDVALSIEFSDPQVAFGFYGTDIGDPEASGGVGGAGSLLLTRPDLSTLLVPIGNNIGTGSRGATLYFGLIDTANPFIKVTFLNDSLTDGFGIDNLTIASSISIQTDNPLPPPQPPTATPEPSTVLLLGSGLAVGGLVLRKRRQTGEPTSIENQ